MNGNHYKVTNNISAMQSKLGLIRNEVVRNPLDQTQLDQLEEGLRETEQHINSITDRLNQIIKEKVHNG